MFENGPVEESLEKWEEGGLDASQVEHGDEAREENDQQLFPESWN